MKLYSVKSELDVSADGSRYDRFEEFVSSAADASKVRTRLKKAGHEIVDTKGHDVEPTRAGIIKFLNERGAHPSWVSAPVAEAVMGE